MNIYNSLETLSVFVIFMISLVTFLIVLPFALVGAFLLYIIFKIGEIVLHISDCIKKIFLKIISKLIYSIILILRI